jgi:hypothetical protein
MRLSHARAYLARRSALGHERRFRAFPRRFAQPPKAAIAADVCGRRRRATNAALSGAVNFGILLSGAADRPSAPNA